jgi:hypothetical protein
MNAVGSSCFGELSILGLSISVASAPDAGCKACMHPSATSRRWAPQAVGRRLSTRPWARALLTSLSCWVFVASAHAQPAAQAGATAAPIQTSAPPAAAAPSAPPTGNSAAVPPRAEPKAAPQKVPATPRNAALQGAQPGKDAAGGASSTSPAERDKNELERRQRLQASFTQSAAKLREQAQALRRAAQQPGGTEAGKAKILERADRLDERAGKLSNMAQGDTKPVDAAERDIQIRELRGRRAARAKDRLKRRWGKMLEYERVQNELRRHSQRVAKLARIRDMAREAKDAASERRCDALRNREETRHNTAMNTLRILIDKYEAEHPQRDAGAH